MLIHIPHTTTTLYHIYIIYHHHIHTHRQVAKEKEAAYDQVLMVAYAAKLDREAIERENAFQMRMEQVRERV
jgi:hypothetical protein